MKRAGWIQVDALLEQDIQATLPPERAGSQEVLMMRRVRTGDRHRRKQSPYGASFRAERSRGAETPTPGAST